jgi:exo-beta-1,3-glucanase (GH17 family)
VIRRSVRCNLDHPSAVAIFATAVVACSSALHAQPPSLSVQLNGNSFRPGDTLDVRVSLLAAPQPTSIDAYVVLEAPGPRHLSLQPGGALVPGIVPIARAFVPFDLTTRIWSVVVPSGIPVGVYRWLSAATSQGSADVFDGISEARFRVGAAPGAKVFAGLNFSPFMFDQRPGATTVSPIQLTARLATIAPWTRWIRLFGSNDGLDRAPAIARSMGLQVACAAWLEYPSPANEQELSRLEALGRAGLCDLLIVGSETLFQRYLSAGQLVGYIERVRSAVPGVPVTTSDTHGALAAPENAAVLAAVDVVMATIYPYWDGMSIDLAASALASHHTALAARVPGKRVVVSETGWPTCGNTIGAAVPSPENAARYLREVLAWAEASRVEVHYFGAFDEAWKATTTAPQEACWGVWDRLGNLKAAMVPVLFAAQ